MMKKLDVIICPVCGFSFQFDVKKRNFPIKCPMCGHEFGDSNGVHFHQKDYNKKFL